MKQSLSNSDSGCHAQAQLERVFLTMEGIQKSTAKQVWPWHPDEGPAQFDRTIGKLALAAVTRR